MVSYDVYLQVAHVPPDGAKDVRLYSTGSIAVNITDSGSGTDSISSVQANLPITDSGGGTDTPLINCSFIFTDSGVGSEVTPTIAVALTLTDSGAGVDVIALTVNLTITDAGAGSEAPSLTVNLTVTDLGSGSETTLTIQAQVTIAEAGAGSETSITIATSLTVPETAQGVDAPAIVASMTLTDSSTGSDTVAAGLWSTMSDSGTGVEAAPTLTILATGLDVGVAAEFAWRTKPSSPMIDAFSLPHVLLVRVLDEAAVSDKKILEGELPKRMMVGKPGRVVEIEGWSNSQSDFDAMEALVDGTVRTFYHPDGDSFAVIVTGFNESKDATSYDQRGYRITLMETR